MDEDTSQKPNTKCVFTDEECYQPGNGWDRCRDCHRVPDMSNETQYRYLCGIAGQRDKCKKYYGSIGNKEPVWMTQIIKKYHGMTGVETCFDHTRNLETLVISEPYRLHIEDFRNLIKFCDENNISFIVDGDVAWFPGRRRTFRILMTKKKNTGL